MIILYRKQSFAHLSGRDNRRHLFGDLMSKNLSVVIPVYNSQDSLPVLLPLLHKELTSITEAFEIILVNDGSHDQSWQEIEKICQEYKGIRAFDLVRNFGQHNALLCGIRAAKYDIILTMDDDMQHPVNEISSLLKELTPSLDLVYGTPKTEKHRGWRKLSSKLTKWALKVSLHIPYAERVSAFRIFRSSLRDSFKDYSNPYLSIDVLLSWGTTRIGFVEVEHDERKLGKSQYDFHKLLRHASNMILGFSVLPLRIASLLGLLFTLIGFLILMYVLIRYFIHGGAVPGFSFLASTISIFSGIILFVLGIMGEYLARIYINMMSKPTYSIYRQIGG